MDLIRYYKNLNRGEQMKPEEMTNSQIDDYVRKYEFQEYNQLQVVTKEEQLLKKIQVKIQKLKAERNVRNSRRQKQMKIGG